ncbi:MAG: exodeoxyribonuclease VII large subunit, partial [Bacteroidales bacterium]
MREGSSIGLLELQEEIGKALESALQRSYWIRAEISEIKQQSTGHCYLELVEKKQGEDSISARAQAIIWSSIFRMLRPYFTTTTGEELSRGMMILVKAQVQYTPLYGLSLIISDIDPSYTVGEQELKRQKTIQRLREEGMFDMNSTLELACLPGRIAVVSSEGAAGYRDFMMHLHNNDYGFRFTTELFSSSVQGIAASSEIISALERVALRAEEFDLVAIVRGGGSVQDLSCFDDYELAANIAQFPLPVVTGIGHDHDVHVADMVAFAGLKTPTAVADFIIEIFASEEQRLAYLVQRLNLALRGRVAEETAKIDKVETKIISKARERITAEFHKTELLLQRINSGNPLLLLERGYAIPVINDKRVN